MPCRNPQPQLKNNCPYETNMLNLLWNKELINNRILVILFTSEGHLSDSNQFRRNYHGENLRSIFKR